MSHEFSDSQQYAHLPEELMAKILEAVPSTVKKMNEMFDIQDQPIIDAINHLRDRKMIELVAQGEYSSSVIAVDGGVVLDRMTGSDVLLAVAVGVEGLSQDTSVHWGTDRNQYYQWQSVLPHEEANPRLAQGVMFLMELSVLAKAEHEIRIMDGTHFTPLLKVNSMLSADEDKASNSYIEGLKAFLRETYGKIIPDIPDIVKAAFQDDSIIALAKYSSSRDILDEFVPSPDVKVDDKTFFSLGLNENECLSPLSVGQSSEERVRIWDDLHIICNLKIPERAELNTALRAAVEPLRTRDSVSRQEKLSELFFTYYKPYEDGPAYRIEIKKSLAQDKPRFLRMLRSLKNQIVFPEIREPFPQYLVDLMAKSVASGMQAIHEGIRLSPDLRIDKGKFNLIFNYRT